MRRTSTCLVDLGLRGANAIRRPVGLRRTGTHDSVLPGSMTSRRIPWWLGTTQIGARGRALGVLGAYAGVGALSAGVSVSLGHNPLACDAWMGTRGAAS